MIENYNALIDEINLNRTRANRFRKIAIFFIGYSFFMTLNFFIITWIYYGTK